MSLFTGKRIIGYLVNCIIILNLILFSGIKDLYANVETVRNLINRAPFNMPVFTLPEIPDRTVNIAEFGAVGDGFTKNTESINSAITKCAENGGGRIIIPPGIWLTGPIHLKSNIELHIQKGALLLFSRDYDDYPLVKSTFEGTEQFRCASPINGVDLDNIAITGSGIIDGSGDAWRPVKRFKMTSRQWRELLDSGGVVTRDKSIWWPTRAAMNGADYLAGIHNKKNITEQDVMPARDFLRPVMVRLTNCKNVLLDGPTFQNSPAWNIHPLLCENMIVKNITVRNPWFSQNGDGIDLESCKNVVVYDSEFDVGDDAICLKSGKNEAGRRRGRPSENIIINNCIVFHGHGGVTTGSEMSGDIRNIWISDCTFMGTDVGLRFKSIRGRGGVVENMYFYNIKMTDIKNEAILFDLFYEGGYDASEPVPDVNEGTPAFKKIYFDTITSLNAKTSILIQGLPEMPINEIVFKNMLMSSENGIHCSFTEGVEFDDLNITVRKNPVIYIHQSDDLNLQTSDITYPEGVLVNIEGENSRNIQLIGTDFQKARNEKLFNKGALPKAVKIMQK